MKTYLIKDLERLSGIKAHTIRIWEQRYDLLSPTRSETNIRHYQDDDLRKLLNISLLQNKGYKISTLSKMDDTQIYSVVDGILNISTDYTTDLESKIQGLVISMVELDEVRFNQIFNSTVAELGFQTTIINLIYPFLMRIGVMWGVNKILPAQEHFISCLVRQKLIAAINELPKPNKEKTFVVFLPANERHEIGVLLGNYILKSYGFKTIYLGQDVPSKDLIDIIEQLNCKFIFTVITLNIEGSGLQNQINKLLNNFDELQILISANKSILDSLPSQKRINKLGNIQEFIDYIKS
ncbi:MAG: MerR family transcriptional regulator [Salibacteraceae bacterium]